MQMHQQLTDYYSSTDFGFELLYGIGITHSQYILIRHLLCNKFCEVRQRYMPRYIEVDNMSFKMPGPPCIQRVIKRGKEIMKEHGVKSLHNGTSIEVSALWEKADKTQLYRDDDGNYWIQIFFDACTTFKKGRRSIVNGGLRIASNLKHWNQFRSVENL